MHTSCARRSSLQSTVSISIAIREYLFFRLLWAFVSDQVLAKREFVMSSIHNLSHLFFHGMILIIGRCSRGRLYPCLDIALFEELTLRFSPTLC